MTDGPAIDILAADLYVGSGAPRAPPSVHPQTDGLDKLQSMGQHTVSRQHTDGPWGAAGTQ